MDNSKLLEENRTLKEELKKAQEINKKLEEAANEIPNNTFWRLTDEDIYYVLEDRYEISELSVDIMDELSNQFSERFLIEDWADRVEIFFDFLMDDNKYLKEKIVMDQVEATAKKYEVSLEEIQIEEIYKEVLNNNDDFSKINSEIKSAVMEFARSIVEKDMDEEAKFFDKGDFLVCPELKDDYTPYQYFWGGDFRSKEYTELFNRCDLPAEDKNKLYIYSVAEEEGESYVSEGKRYVNRLGYYFSKVPITPFKTFRIW